MTCEDDPCMNIDRRQLISSCSGYKDPAPRGLRA